MSDLKLISGKVSLKHFEVLLSLTSIRSEELINALREHLVDGLPAPRAWEKYNINKGLFSRRLRVLNDTHNKVSQIVIFYQ